MKTQPVDRLAGEPHVRPGTNGAQPDWYLGWLIGALRLAPGREAERVRAERERAEAEARAASAV